MNHVDVTEIARSRKLRRKIVLRPIGPTLAAEIALGRVTGPVIRELRRSVATRAIPLLPQAKQQLTADNEYAEFTSVNRVLDNVTGLAYFFRQLRDYLGVRFDGLAPIIMEILMDEEKRHRAGFVHALNSNLGINLSEILRGADLRFQVEAAVERHVSLIKGLGDDLVKKVSFDIIEAANKGESVASLSKKLNEHYNWGMKRSRFIARDQMATFNSTLNRVRQTQVGIEEYEWITARDERVRPEHAARHGKIYSWKKPPSDGHPGEPINCRCIARAIVSA